MTRPDGESREGVSVAYSQAETRAQIEANNAQRWYEACIKAEAERDRLQAVLDKVADMYRTASGIMSTLTTEDVIAAVLAEGSDER